MKTLKAALLLYVLSHALNLIATKDGISRSYSPTAQTASTEGVASLWHNPAGLAFMGGQESQLNYLYEWNELGNRHHGGANLALNFWRTLTLGLGINTQAAFSDRATSARGTDLSGIFASAIKLSNHASFGISFAKSHNFLLQKSSPTLISFGTQIRPWSFLSMGSSYEKVHEGFLSAPNLTAGISVRPYKEHLTIGLDHIFVANGQAWKEGFTIHPRLGLKTVYGGYGASVSAEIPGYKDGWNKPIFTMALDINLAHLGLSLNGLINAKNNNYGMGTSIRLSSDEWPSVANPQGLFVELTIEHDGTLQHPPMGFAERLFMTPESPLSTLALLKRLESDPMIEGVLLNFDGFSFGDGRTQEWRDALLALRQAGKTVVVYLDAPSERDYYIASAANQIFMNKEATLSLRQFQATLVYFADLLHKIGIKADAIAAGSYKTAPRQWTHSRPEKEEIEVMNNILNNFYQQLLLDVAKARNIDEKLLKELFDKGEITATEALQAGLVDHAAYSQDVVNILDQQGFPHVFFPNYEKRERKQTSWREPKKIVVIPITNAIVDGRGMPGLFSGLFPKTYAKDVVDEIEEAQKDPDVLGIIVRIDSPGGDVLAGTRITQALAIAKNIKPVVASMSDVAASAGYMVASNTSHILALPNTITGSIGVFSLMFSGEKLADKVGIFSKELSPLKNPGPTIFRGITVDERKEAQRVVDWYYRNFIQTVSAGLVLDEAEVKKHAEGHVWLGSEALEKKLIHELGGFSKAIDSVLTLASVPKDEHIIIEIKKPGYSDHFTLGAGLMSLFKHDNLDVDMKHLATMAKPYVSMIEAYRLQGYPQARLPFDISWRNHE